MERIRWATIFADGTPVELAYRFPGAHRRTGTAYDMALYLGSELEEAEYEEWRRRLAERVAVVTGKMDVGLFILNGTSSNLAHGVVTQGKLLYARDESVLKEFEADVRTAFLRTVYESSVASWRPIT